MKFLATMAAAAAITVASVSGASAVPTVTYDTVTDWTPYNLTAAKTGSLGGGTWDVTDPAAPRLGSAATYRSPFDGSGVEDPATNFASLPFWAIGPSNPAGNADNHATLKFANDRSGFSFVWGSVDSYNSIEFFNGAASTLLLTSSVLAAGFPTNLGAIFVTVSDIVFDRIVFKSTNQEALEVGLFASVPIPAGVLLLGSGLAGLGFLGWRRKRTTGVATA